MKRKHKVYYTVTVKCEPDLYYDCEKRRWNNPEYINGVSSSHATFYTFKRAMKNAIGLIFKTDKEVILTRFFYRNGHRWSRDWVARRKHD